MARKPAAKKAAAKKPATKKTRTRKIQVEVPVEIGTVDAAARAAHRALAMLIDELARTLPSPANTLARAYCDAAADCVER